MLSRLFRGFSFKRFFSKSYLNPSFSELGSISWKIKKDKIILNKNFYVFTGSTVGVVPIKKKGFYKGIIESLGSVQAKTN